MSKKLIVGIVLVLIVVALAIYSQPKHDSDIVIGAIIPQTGFGAYWGDPVLKGIRLAEADLKIKYPNENIKIIVDDSQSKAPAAVTVAQKMLDIDGADALYTEFGGISSAVSPVAESAGKLFVYSTFNQKIAEDNKTSLKTFISFETACGEFAKHLNDSNKKILIISSIGDSAPYCARGLEKHIKKENIKVVDGFTGTDFRTTLLQNKEFAADYIVPIMYEEGSFALIKQKNELGLKSNFFCYKQDCATDKLIHELPKEYTDGVYYFEIPLRTEFVNKIMAANPGMPTDSLQGAANSYQSMMIAADALVNCGEGDSKCNVEYMNNRKDIAYSAYNNAYFDGRVLASEISIGVVKNGVPTKIK